MFGIGDTQNPKGKVYRYRCVESCTFQGKYYRQGSVIVLAEERKVPHFEPVQQPAEKTAEK